MGVTTLKHVGAGKSEITYPTLPLREDLSLNNYTVDLGTNLRKKQLKKYFPPQMPRTVTNTQRNIREVTVNAAMKTKPCSREVPQHDSLSMKNLPIMSTLFNSQNIVKTRSLINEVSVKNRRLKSAHPQNCRGGGGGVDPGGGE